MNKTILLVLLLVVTFAFSAPIRAEQKQPAPPKSPNDTKLADENVKQLLLLMDTDKNGKISKDEWMRFMAAEFDRLDKDKSGELDPNELRKSRMSIRAFHFADQGK